MKHIQKQAFTLIELVVIVTILSVLSVIGMMSYFSFTGDARDTARLSDINNMVSVISISEIKNGYYPPVSNPIEVTFEGSEIWQEGVFGQETYTDVRTLSDIPTDPLTGEYYSYSFSKKSREFQIGGVLEKSYELSYIPFVSQTYAKDFSSYDSSIVRGTYNGKFLTHINRISALERQVFILGLPSIVSRSTSSRDVNTIIENNDLVFDGKKAIPGSYMRDQIIDDENWEFEPEVTPDGVKNNSKVVVYEGTNIELSSNEGKKELVENLQSYYENTDISDTEIMQGLLRKSPEDATQIIDSFVDGNIGGLENAGIRTQ